MKGFALTIALKQRRKGTLEWAIRLIWKPAVSFGWLGAHAPVSERSNPSRTRFETEAKGNSGMGHSTDMEASGFLRLAGSTCSCKREK